VQSDRYEHALAPALYVAHAALRRRAMHHALSARRPKFTDEDGSYFTMSRPPPE